MDERPRLHFLNFEALDERPRLLFLNFGALDERPRLHFLNFEALDEHPRPSFSFCHVWAKIHDLIVYFENPARFIRKPEN